MHEQEYKMTSDVWTMDAEGMTQFANQVKEVVIKQLASEGWIAHPEQILGDYVVIVHKQGVLGRAMKKVFWKGESKAPVVTMLKVVGPKDE
jgi:hypothetical protein